MAKKFYAVAKGKECGIFTDWPSCEKQVKGVAGAKYKSFPTKEAAKAWLENPVYEKKKAVSQGEKEQTATKEILPPGGITIYTDGGAIGNPGPGGYGIVINDEKEKELSGGFRHTTNNRMELMAAVVALQQVADMGRVIHLYSDSSYLVNGMNKGWAKGWRKREWRKSDGEPALNADLWAELLDLTEQCEVKFFWVKGHAGNPLNERCDELAVSAAKNTPTEVDSFYEESLQKVS